MREAKGYPLKPGYKKIAIVINSELFSRIKKLSDRDRVSFVEEVRIILEEAIEHHEFQDRI